MKFLGLRGVTLEHLVKPMQRNLNLIIQMCCMKKNKQTKNTASTSLCTSVSSPKKKKKVGESLTPWFLLG